MKFVRTMVRLPEEINDWLKAQAQQNYTSRNAEMIRSVRERMELEQAGKK